MPFSSLYGDLGTTRVERPFTGYDYGLCGGSGFVIGAARSRIIVAPHTLVVSPRTAYALYLRLMSEGVTPHSVVYVRPPSLAVALLWSTIFLWAFPARFSGY